MRKPKPQSKPKPSRGTQVRSQVFPDLPAINAPPESEHWPVVNVIETGRQQVFPPLGPADFENGTRIVVVENGREVVYQSVGPAEVPPGAKAWQPVVEPDTPSE